MGQQRPNRCYNFQMADGAARANSATSMMLMLTVATTRRAAGSGGAVSGRGGLTKIDRRLSICYDDEDDEGVVL